jgi:prefoldin alpha subunit
MMKGQLSEPKKVCVDVGTGYFIVMSPKRAINYFERKIKELEGNINQAMESRQVILQQIKSIKESASTE